MSRRHFEIGVLSWTVLTVIGWGADLYWHQALVAPWLRALFLGRVQPTVWAVLHALPIGTWAIAMIAVAPAAVIGYVVGLSEENEDEHRRGAQMTSADRLAKKIAPENEAGAPVETRLALAGIPMPDEIETQHVLIAGGIGTGKSTLLRALAPLIRRRGERAVIIDPGGEMLAKYWQKGDAILNALDARSEGWSPFAEMDVSSDSARIAKTLFPDIDGAPEAQQWQHYSQALTSAVLRRLFESGNATNASLLHMLTIAGRNELGPLVEGLPATRLFGEGSEKMLSNALAIIGLALDPISYLPPHIGTGAWSLRRWVESGEGWLWLPYRTGDRALLAPLICGQIGELVSATLMLRPSAERRIWLLLDELAALGRIQALGDALAQGRRFGLCAVGAVQTIAQLREKYGAYGAQALLACFSSQIILRTPDPETASWCSQLLGQRQIKRTVESSGTGGGGSHTGESEQITIEPLVLPSEIQNLPKLHAYLKYAGSWPVARITIPIPPKAPEVCPPFVPVGSANPVATAEAPATIATTAQVDTAPAPVPAAPDPDAALTEQFRKLLLGEKAK